MKYPFVKYVDTLPNDFAGMANGPFIRIIKSHKNDKGLYAHEIEHVKQWFKLPFIHSLLYKFVRKYRLYCEVKAYRIQLKYYQSDEYTLAMFLSTKYDLGILPREAHLLLTGK
jgi:hypothetical protein